MQNSASPSKALIYSRHIFPNEVSDPIHGFISIENGRFSAIKPINSLPKNFLNDYKDYTLFDYENLYIFPGIIDTNVHLAATYDLDWVDIEGVTKTALRGGITTIIDTPVPGNALNIDEDHQQIKSHFSQLENNLYCDCGIFAFLDPYNIQNIPELIKTGVFGFKGYLSPCLDFKFPYFSKKNLHDLKKLLTRTPIDTLFVFHDEICNERDLYLCSPCRSVEKACRIDSSYKVGDTCDFGGGFHGEVEETMDSGAEEETDNVLDLELIKENRSYDCLGSPTTAILKLDAEIFSKLEQEKGISIMEESQYDAIQTEMSKFDEKWVEENSDLALSEEGSEDFSDLDRSDVAQKNSCPSFKPRNSLCEISKSPFHLTMKKMVMTTLEINLNVTDNASEKMEPSNTHSEREVNSSQEVEEKKENEVSPVLSGKLARSPKKRESGLLKRRKKQNSMQIEGPSSPLSTILTSFKKNKEEEEKKSHSYVFTILINHPISFENDGVKFIYRTFKNEKNARVLISNLSTAKMAFFIRDHRKGRHNPRIYTETAVPYLFFCSDMIKKGQTKFKTSPPIREKQDMLNSIFSLKHGAFDVVSSYHLQVPRPFKSIENGNFRRAFSGTSSIGFNLQSIWTRVFSVAKGKYGKECYTNPEITENLFKTLIRVLSINPAKILGISHIKGEIKKGNDADFLVWDPFLVKKVKKKHINMKYPKVHIFRGTKLYGKVVATFLRGERVFEKDQKKEVVFTKRGEILKRTNN